MNLHILEMGKDNSKSIQELFNANKHVIQLPTTINKLIIIIHGFWALTTILFGKQSCLAEKLKSFYREIQSNKLNFKAKAATDQDLIANMNFLIDTRIQLWLGFLQRTDDRELVNDSVLDFGDITLSVLLGVLQVVLPKIFTQPKITKEPSGEPLTKKTKLKKEVKPEEKKKIVNPLTPPEFH
jgi:hypothetical protein